MQTWYLEGGKLGASPAELEVYELALSFNKLPDEIRGMSADDRLLLTVVREAQREAQAELARRAHEKQAKET